MASAIIVDPANYPIKPADIDATWHLYEAFGHMETEKSAMCVVRLCQEKGGWFPFTLEEIEAVYQRAGCKGYYFNRLVEPELIAINAAQVFGGAMPQTKPVGGGWLVKGADGKYHVTEDFVKRCHKSRPVNV